MMKAGKYWVGDLCYVFDDDWSDVLDVIIDGEKVLEGEFNLADGRRFAVFNTAYGDGEYRDQKGHSYYVDAGSIGCILVDDIKANKYDDLTKCGNIVEFTKDFAVFEDSGLITFGHIEIDTDPRDDWNDMDYDEEVFEEWETR
jgi:hypothetical protein